MRVLLTGLGSVARRHAKNLRALGVTDLRVWRTLKRPLPEGEHLPPMAEFDTLSEALAAGPTAVFVCGPPSTHLQVALEAAKAGCHLFIEKPLADSLDGTDDLRAIVERQRLVAMVGFNLRFHPGLRVMKQLIDDGRIGRVHALLAQVGQYLPDWHPYEDYRTGYSASRRLGGGVILDLIHELDYARWLVGDFREVACLSGHVSALEIDSDDLAAMVLRFDGGIATLQLDYLQRTATRTCRVVGDRGSLAWDYYQNEVVLHADHGGRESFREPEFQRNDMFVAEVEHFLDCLDGRTRPIVDLREAICLQRLAAAAIESSREKRFCPIPASEEAICPESS